MRKYLINKMNRSMNNLNRMYKRAELSDRVSFTKTNGRQAEGIVVSRQGRGVPGSTFKDKMAKEVRAATALVLIFLQRLHWGQPGPSK